MSDKFYAEMNLYEARLAVAAAGAEYITSRVWDELHPDDPNGGNSVDYRMDCLDDAIRKYNFARSKM